MRTADLSLWRLACSACPGPMVAGCQASTSAERQPRPHGGRPSRNQEVSAEGELVSRSPEAIDSGRECVAEVAELAVVDGAHPDVLSRSDVRRSVVDEQALMHWGADPLRGVEVHAGVG